MTRVILILCIFVIACAAPPEDLASANVPEAQGRTVQTGQAGDARPVDTEGSTFAFTGYGPGESHTGVFTEFSGTVTVNDGTITGAEGTIDAASVDTGIPGLDRKLRSGAFLHVDEHPRISFSDGRIDDGTMRGGLTFLGTTKQISFPVSVEKRSLRADFTLDLAPFGFSYPGVRSTVRFNVTLQAAQ